MYKLKDEVNNEAPNDSEFGDETTMAELHEIPQGSKIRIKANKKVQIIIFDHLDGMYSYCYLESDPKKTCHLSRFTPLVLAKDGVYEIAL